MNTKHTPGPWGALGRNRHEQKTIPLRSIHCERLGYSIAFVSYDRDGETEANARLISAAPDLLAACIAMLDERSGAAQLSDASQAARAAIAKATGAAQ
jgi:hypothetical protein